MTLQKPGVKRLILRFVLMMGLFVLYGFLHGKFTEHFFVGYKITVVDGFVLFAPYVFVVFIILIFWRHIRSFGAIEVSRLETIGWTILSLFFLFLPFDFWYQLSSPAVMFLRESISQGVAKFFLFLALFGSAFLKKFWREIAILFLLVIPFVLAPVALDILWERASTITIWGFEMIAEILGLKYAVGPAPYEIMLENYRVYIGPGCAGINSLLVFISLFTAYMLMLKDREVKVSATNAVSIFALGIFLVFLLNSLRVFLILAVGAYYSPEIAANIFHSYIGSVLMITFIFFYFKIANRLFR